MYYRVRVKDNCQAVLASGRLLASKEVEIFLPEGADMGVCCYYVDGSSSAYTIWLDRVDFEIIEELELVTKSSVCNQEISEHISSHGEVTNKNNAIKDIFGHNISKITVEYTEP
jgi:hypothetical protein